MTKLNIEDLKIGDYFKRTFDNSLFGPTVVYYKIISATHCIMTFKDGSLQSYNRIKTKVLFDANYNYKIWPERVATIYIKQTPTSLYNEI